MMRKKMRLFAAAAVGLACLGACLFPAKAPARAEETVWDYEQSFTDLAAVEADFNAYYLENALGVSKPEAIVTSNEAEEHWRLDNGAIVRQNDVLASADTNKIAILTFSKYSYSNFELSVDYKQGNQSFWWPVVGFRQAEEGKYTLSDGAGVFVQQGGEVTLWGTTPVGGPYQTSALPGYDRNVFHTMRLVVQGNKLQVFIDDHDAVEWSLPKDFYQSGYISLISVNNDTTYKNFKVRVLPEPEEPEKPKFDPVPDAGTEDSLNSMAGEPKPETELMERENLWARTETEPGEGCGNAEASASILLAGLLAVFGIKKFIR